MSAVMKVDFHGTELILVEKDGEPLVPMKPVVEGMGLAWQPQHRKLTTGRFASTIIEMRMAAQDSKLREMTCLPLRKLAGWLMTIHPSKVREELRGKIIAYQAECDDVLWRYWNDGRAENPRAAANDPVIPIERRLPVAADNFEAAKRLSESLGLSGNQATLSANRMVKETLGIDVLELAGIQRLANEAQELNYTPTELGAKFSMNARDMNKLLERCGLQRHFEYAKGKKRWELLPDGKPFAVIVDTPKKHSDGKPVQQILWKESVLEMLKRLAEKLRADLPKRPDGKV